MSISVQHPGMRSILVDAGRPGFAQRGITHSGPADPDACYWANRLVRNQHVLPSIEVLFGGLTLRVNQECTISVTGAELDLKVDGSTVNMWQGMRLYKGQQLALGYAKKGVRAYVAVAGGFKADAVFGSVSCVTREHIGGLNGDGQPLREGDLIPLSDQATTYPLMLPVAARPQFYNHFELALVPCYQWQDFSRSMHTRLIGHEYEISQQSDRMGVRLKGIPIVSSAPLAYSEGLALGSVQCPPDGQPIIMLNDRQTIGGYPKPGVISTLDCGVLGQARPGDTVSFYLSDVLTERARRLLHTKKLSATPLLPAD